MSDLSLDVFNSELFKHLTNLHNNSVTDSLGKYEFTNHVLANKGSINNTDFLIILIEHVDISDDYFRDNEEFCKFCYDFIKLHPEWSEKDYGFGTLIRIGVFEDHFSDYLEDKSREIK